MADEAVVRFLQDSFVAEIVSIRQYLGHSALQRNQGYDKLATKVAGEIPDELGHATKFADRLAWMEEQIPGTSVVPVTVAPTIPEQLKADLELEKGAVKRLNSAIAASIKAGDGGSRRIFEEVLEDEEHHVQFLRHELKQIEQMGLENYLSSIK